MAGSQFSVHTYQTKRIMEITEIKPLSCPESMKTVQWVGSMVGKISGKSRFESGVENWFSVTTELCRNASSMHN